MKLSCQLSLKYAAYVLGMILNASDGVEYS